MQDRWDRWLWKTGLLTLGVGACFQTTVAEELRGPFQRVASFPVFQNTDPDEETVAEIVAAAQNGTLLVYTDGETENLGLVDISDPTNPSPEGVIPLGGEPTSVAVREGLALACVNTSPDFVNPSGDLQIVDLSSRSIVRTIPLGGQPDAIAISPDQRYAAIAIENERDEDLGDGEPPQAPPGFLVIVDLMGSDPQLWTTRTVDLVGIPTLFPNDPEPEYVDINGANLAVVSLQENNHLVIIDLASGRVIQDFPAGTVDLEMVDDEENDLIEQVASLTQVPREPDAVAWTSRVTFASADEGDLFGGSRGFTHWSLAGRVLYEPGNSLEHMAARLGQYPEDRSENKGVEPEAVEFGRYGPERFLFVGSERANLVFVYELSRQALDGPEPQLRQVLPAGVGPEGLLAIPERDLLIVANEVDDRGDKIRSSLMIYQYTGETAYPALVSENREGATTPIPWGALSGLAAERGDDSTVFAVHDSFYQKSRIYEIDRSTSPARITDELVLHDHADRLIEALEDLKAELPGTDDFDPTSFVNGDGTVNLDLEGVARDLESESFWLVSEGAGNLEGGVSDPDNRPFESPNLLIRAVFNPGFPPFVEPFDLIAEVIPLPLELTRNQLRFGLEGVAALGNPASGEVRNLYVVFQRAWEEAGDPETVARIGRYDRFRQTWTFVHYPLDEPTSANGGWVGLSELTHLGRGQFAVLERDNQGGPDATVKRIYRIDLSAVDFRPHEETADFELIEKSLVIDLLEEGVFDFTAGLTPEKLEGLAILSDRSALLVNDNDGVDDNNGETLLVELEDLFRE